MGYYFKILTDNKRGGFTHYIYPPKGEWTPSIKGKLIPCQNGYHVCRVRNIFNWLNGYNRRNVWLVETKGCPAVYYNKVVVKQVKLIKKFNLRLVDLKKITEKLDVKVNTSSWIKFKHSYNFHSIDVQKQIMREVLNIWGLRAKF